MSGKESSNFIEKEKERSRDISIKEGSAYSIMDGFGLRYISAFAVSLGASNSFVGLLSTLPNLLGNFGQIFSLKVMNSFSRKNIVFLSVLFQALCWIPLSFIGLAYLLGWSSARTSLTILIIIYSLLISIGAFGGPAWNSWMRDIVPERSGSFFGKRGAITGLVALISMLLAGLILDLFREDGKLLIGFAIIFSLAFLGRAISAYFFTKQYEPKYKNDPSTFFTFRQFVRHMSQNNFGHFVIFLGTFGFACSLSLPYFAVYMLKDLNLESSYIIYTTITIISIIVTLSISKYWGNIIDRFGNIQVLKFNALFISLLPLLWVFSYPLYAKIGIWVAVYLIIIEIFSGIFWSGFNLASSVFIFDAVTKQRMALCVTYNGIISSVGAVLGAIIGSLIMKFSPMHPILFIFIISTLARIIVVLYLGAVIKEVRKVEKINPQDLRRYFSPRNLIDQGIRRLGFAASG